MEIIRRSDERLIDDNELIWKFLIGTEDELKMFLEYCKLINFNLMLPKLYMPGHVFGTGHEHHCIELRINLGEVAVAEHFINHILGENHEISLS